MPGSTFSESWYQVADARVALLPTVKAQPQRYRGKPWVMLEDPYSQRYFRVTPEAHAFLKSLSTERSVDELWHEHALAHPDRVPGQDEVVRLLSQLHLSNLLHFKGQPHNDLIFERSRSMRRRESVGKLMAFLYVRVPLVNPDRWLDRLQPLLLRMTGPWAWALWWVVLLAGGATVIEHRDALAQHSQGMLAVSNLGWLYLSLTLVKVLHELAHAFVCKRYGAHVPTMGVMFLILTPLPYIDATATWSLRSKWQRAHVGAAGMLAELFIAAVGALVWAHTGDGLVHSVAFNVMVVGSVSSLLFNGNPLVRFDAYYILADLVEIPNLYQKGQQQWLYFANRWLLGLRNSMSPATDPSEWWWFTAYGAAAFFYRISITISIVMFVTDQWFGVGLLMAATTAFGMLVMPARKLISHLAGPALHGRRSRALTAVALLVGLLYLLLVWSPMPYAMRAPGVLEARNSSMIYSEVPGMMVELPARHGQALRRGDLIARLRNPDLELQLELSRLQRREIQAQQRLALLRMPADVAPLQQRLDVLDNRIKELEDIIAGLVLHAAHDGEWVAPQLHERLGGWLERGFALGEVIDRTHFRFTAVVEQDMAAQLFQAEQHTGGLRLHGQASQLIKAEQIGLVPYQRQKLASPALGFLGGGDVAVRPDDSSGTQTAEAFFEIHASIADTSLAMVSAYHGLSGVLRIDLPARPLYERAREALMQVLQKRYGL